MASFSRAVERLYHAPVVGRAFSTLGSLLRVVQWRVEHANRIAEQSRVIAEQAAATAAREAALGARIDALTRSLEVQAAVTSTVQRLAQAELEKARDASKAAIAAKDELEGAIADALNAATLNELSSKSLREDLQALRETAGSDRTAIRDEIASLEQRLAGRIVAAEADSKRAVHSLEEVARDRDALRAQMVTDREALRVQLATDRDASRAHAATDLEALRLQMASDRDAVRAQMVAEIEAMRAQIAGDRETARAHAAAERDAMQTQIASIERRITARLAELQDTANREDLEGLRREIGSMRMEVTQASTAGNAVRDELWRRAGALEGELARRSQLIDDVNARFATFANQVASLDLATQLTALRTAVEHVTGRVEFVRRETLLESRYGAARGAADGAEPRIVNAKKVRAMRDALRLNVGCGHIMPAEFVNVDQRDLPGVDVIAEAGHLPFPAGSVVELYSAHFLEHFPQERLRRELLPYFKSLLKPGGMLRAVVPDAEAMISEYAAGRYSYAELREVTFGAQDYDGDFHYNMFTPESLSALLREAGFSKVEVPVKGRRNGACYEFEVVAS